MIVRGLASGYRICVSPSQHLGYLLGTHESHLQKIIRQYVAAGDTVYDIGANLGYVTLSLAKCVGAHGRVVAFEPVAQTARLLRENVQTNRLANVSVVESAASDQCGEATIRIANNPSMASLVWHKEDPSATAMVVKTVAIDQLVASGEIDRPSFVKIDVEGAEDRVLMGMRGTLAVARPVLFVECSQAGRRNAWDLLRDLGYRCQEATTRRWVDLFDEYFHCDFLWLPTDRRTRAVAK